MSPRHYSDAEIGKYWSDNHTSSPWYIHYNGLILAASICFVHICTVLFSKILLPSIFSLRFTQLLSRHCHGVVYHSLAFVLKLAILLGAIYPIGVCLLTRPGLSTKLYKNGYMTYGDLIMIFGDLFAAVAVLDMFYHYFSALSCVMNVYAIVLAQVALTMAPGVLHHPSTQYSGLVICILLGIFNSYLISQL